MDKTVLITGVNGQDGSYLADYILGLPSDIAVVGTVRRSSHDNLGRIRHLLHHPRFNICYADMLDKASLNSVFDKFPNITEVYHLAAQSHVGLSFHMPDYTFKSIVEGTWNILSVAASVNNNIKFYHASSSEQFGKAFTDHILYGKCQTEDTPFMPVSPYAIAKTSAHNMTKYFRSTKQLKTYTGILFNHESPRRGEQFVTRKITKFLGDLLSSNNTTKLRLGNIDSFRDWGYAPDYVRAIYQLVQQNRIYNTIVATGTCYTIRDFLDAAFSMFNLCWKDFVVAETPENQRPFDVVFLRGISNQAKQYLGWEPSVTFNELVEIMVKHDAGIPAEATI